MKGILKNIQKLFCREDKQLKEIERVYDNFIESPTEDMHYYMAYRWCNYYLMNTVGPVDITYQSHDGYHCHGITIRYRLYQIRLINNVARLYYNFNTYHDMKPDMTIKLKNNPCTDEIVSAIIELFEEIPNV